MLYVLAAIIMVAATANGPHPGEGVLVAAAFLFWPVIWWSIKLFFEGFFLGWGARMSGVFKRRR
jgi:hypothetical protein